jgi:hypothetical protein
MASLVRWAAQSLLHSVGPLKLVAQSAVRFKQNVSQSEPLLKAGSSVSLHAGAAFAPSCASSEQPENSKQPSESNAATATLATGPFMVDLASRVRSFDQTSTQVLTNWAIYGGGGNGNVVAAHASSAPAQMNKIPPHPTFTVSTLPRELVVGARAAERSSAHFYWVRAQAQPAFTCDSDGQSDEIGTNPAVA